MMTGIFREVGRSYSPNPGAMATRSAYMRSRSLPFTSRALTWNVSVPVFAPTSTVATGFALRLRYHAGLSGAPPFDATTTYRSPSRWYITGEMRSCPLRAPPGARRRSRSPNPALPLKDDALGLIVVEVDLVLQRPAVLGPRDLHGSSGQALEFLELTFVELEPIDPLELTRHDGHFRYLTDGHRRQSPGRGESTP